jgi:hypothetical protein
MPKASNSLHQELIETITATGPETPRCPERLRSFDVRSGSSETGAPTAFSGGACPPFAVDPDAWNETMQYTNQIDHCRCILCAEPITGPICLRCGYHHDGRTETTIPENEFVAPSSIARELIRDVEAASFAFGAHNSDTDESYEALFADSVARGGALRNYVAHLEAANAALEVLLLRGRYRLFSPKAQTAIQAYARLAHTRGKQWASSKS